MIIRATILAIAMSFGSAQATPAIGIPVYPSSPPRGDSYAGIGVVIDKDGWKIVWNVGNSRPSTAKKGLRKQWSGCYSGCRPSTAKKGCENR